MTFIIYYIYLLFFVYFFFLSSLFSHDSSIFGWQNVSQFTTLIQTTGWIAIKFHGSQLINNVMTSMIPHLFF